VRRGDSHHWKEKESKHVVRVFVCMAECK
jgi:hypothetical protein